MPISRATARSDRPAAPSVASCRRAISVISLISSARTRSRAVRLAFTEAEYQSTALQARAALASTCRMIALAHPANVIMVMWSTRGTSP